MLALHSPSHLRVIGTISFRQLLVNLLFLRHTFVITAPDWKLGFCGFSKVRKNEVCEIGNWECVVYFSSIRETWREQRVSKF